MYIKLSKHKSLEINWDQWNPLKNIIFEFYFNILLEGSHSPAIYIVLDFLCFGFDIEFYDNRHKEDREG